ncbi:fumarate reductase subunit FrdC [Vibrio sp. S17_S38]|uniref:fumarate reductase subunit FrdC n=1 Tax=Vibrio sp. S17_S38 TaxID=2720229 RepID=UPI00167FE360|nr:fumarate reductase subunit FrdC [Vibrio sp. S17_S38]MBD1573240.1 fumarate reductase subunit FrdC [Vibrio sp. S17_S38]
MSKRKPYVRTIERTWWSKHPFYRFYMVREATVLPLILFTLFMLCGLASLVKGPQAWIEWQHFMQNPVVIAINIVALAGSLFHAATFFSMMPQVMPIRVKGKLLSPKVIIAAQWGAVTVISLFVLALV